MKRSEFKKYKFLVGKEAPLFNFAAMVAMFALAIFSVSHWAWFFTYAFFITFVVAFGHGMFFLDATAMFVCALRFFLYCLMLDDAIPAFSTESWGLWTSLAMMVAAVANWWIVRTRISDAKSDLEKASAVISK